MAILCVSIALFNVGTGFLCARADDYPEEVISGEEIIGYLYEQDGILLNEDESYVLNSNTGELFSMTATRVYSLLTTYNSTGKRFTGGKFDGFEGTGLLITGKVYLSDADYAAGDIIKVGACYYQSLNDSFVSVASTLPSSGDNISIWFSKAYFSNSITYYGFIRNIQGSGYVHGTLTFSVSTNPNATS